MTAFCFDADEEASEPFHIHIVMTVTIMVAPTRIAQTDRTGGLDLLDHMMTHILDRARRQQLQNILGEMGSTGQCRGGWVL